MQVHQNHVLLLLQENLRLATTRVDESGLSESPRSDPSSPSSSLSPRRDLRRWLDSSGSLKALRYAAYRKKRLEKTLEELESWHRKFDPSWYLLIRLSVEERHGSPRPSKGNQEQPTRDLVIIERLKDVHLESGDGSNRSRSVFFPQEESISQTMEICHSDARVAIFRGYPVVVDSRALSSDTRSSLTQGVLRDTCDIARVLQYVDSVTFGLLSCWGSVKEFDQENQLSGVHLLFTIPNGFSSRGVGALRQLLLDGRLAQSLDCRFRLARQLARSKSFLHSAGLVHKNIRPETIILLQGETSTREIGSQGLAVGTPFLVGFEKFRHDEAQTHMAGDTAWEKNLYRHPARQGEYPEERCRMQHDIYSLGCVSSRLALARHSSLSRTTPRA